MIKSNTLSVRLFAVVTPVFYIMFCPPRAYAQTDSDNNGLKEIRNLRHLNNIRNDLGGGYELMKNLDFTDKNDPGYRSAWDPTVQVGAASPSAGWSPIGTFTGTFEGHGREIKNLYINVSVLDNRSVTAGLFSTVAGGTVQNLGLTGQHMSLSVTQAAGAGGDVRLGSLVGSTSGTVTITRCYATGTVRVSGGGVSFAYAGGLVGAALHGATISNCFATTHVGMSDRYSVEAGGLLGFSRASVTNCRATGDVRVTGGDVVAVGGLIGSGYTTVAVSVPTPTVVSSYATGDVTVDVLSVANPPGSVYFYGGGLVGHANFSFAIRDCHASGNVSASLTYVPGCFAGGLAGSVDEVTRCYATGNVSVWANSYGTRTSVGGLVGNIYTGRHVDDPSKSPTRSYYSGTATSRSTNTLGGLKTLTELKAPTKPGTNSGDIYHSWQEGKWDFGTSSELPTLRIFDGDQTPKLPLEKAPTYTFVSSTATSFTLAGTPVPRELTRRFFVYKNDMSSLSTTGLVDEASIGAGAVAEFNVESNDASAGASCSY